MRCVLAVAAVLGLGLSAQAQQTVVPCTAIPGNSVNDTIASCQKVSQTAPLPVGPGQVMGFGTLAVTTTSTLLSTVAVGPNSAAWPTNPGLVQVWNATGSAGVLYICPLGGSCSTTVGIPVAVGASVQFMHPSSAMTVFAASTANAVAQW